MKFKNITQIRYDIDWIAGVECEGKQNEEIENEEYIEKGQEKNQSKDQYEDLESEEDINEVEQSYLEEYTQNRYYNPANQEQDEKIQEYREEIEIPEVNKISDTQSTASNVIRSEI